MLPWIFRSSQLLRIARRGRTTRSCFPVETFTFSGGKTFSFFFHSSLIITRLSSLLTSVTFSCCTVSAAFNIKDDLREISAHCWRISDFGDEREAWVTELIRSTNKADAHQTRLVQRVYSEMCFFCKCGRILHKHRFWVIKPDFYIRPLAKALFNFLPLGGYDNRTNQNITVFGVTLKKWKLNNATRLSRWRILSRRITDGNLDWSASNRLIGDELLLTYSCIYFFLHTHWFYKHFATHGH